MKSKPKYDRLKVAFGVPAEGQSLKFTIANGSDQSNYDYCSKDGDFWESGIRETIAGAKKGQRSDLDEIKKAIAEGNSYDDICETHFREAAMYGRFIKERIAAKQSEDGKKILLEDYKDVSWKPWQQAVLDVVEETPNRRKIHWIWEGTGHVGKSWLATYLMITKNALILEAGKKVDLIHVFSKNMTKIIIFDLSRTNEATEDQRKHFLDGVYSLAEQMKNGRMITTKYDGMPLCFPIPHVIFMANFEPDYTKWSEDRYLVTKL